MFDQNMNMTFHINNVCRACYMHIRKIERIRKLFDNDTAHTMVRCTILSRLDYCNALLFGLPAKEIRKLQLVQNTAARLITRSLKYEHVTPSLIALHWLPINQRITFKICVMAFKALNVGPEYLSELLNIYISGRTTRQTEKFRLQPPRTRTKKATRGFSCSAPQLLNQLMGRFNNIDARVCSKTI